MRLRTDRRALKTSVAFSLIEVTLALAVISIGIVAVLGLLPHGLQASRDAADSTLAATIVQDTFSTLRSYPFNNALVCDACCPGDTAEYQDLGALTGTLLLSNAYDFAGSSTNFANAYYKVMLSYEPESPSLARVIATVVWPALSVAPINTNVFVTQIAHYE